MYCQKSTLGGVPPPWKSCMLLMVMNVGQPLSAVADGIAKNLYRKQCGEQDHLE